MILNITYVAAFAAVLIAPRMLVALLAILIAATLVCRSRRIALLLLADSSIRSDLNYDRKPSRAERRLMRKSLRLALDQTELRSLFPSTAVWVDRWSGLAR
ncbi:hypothetical protein [Sphingomonas sp. 10B4]|uniref:hypothetical protein n=1 Tax=Sphingomonas sp. 10B4 TaxID=3048575 RepID=UPI002AB380E7|nr:hypothetical protein [Sphingomonas sp. 10B4]MDY7524629.1 hypothetical protein [Sphingomonas sp. 10B4]MEB0282416.1 hypothetical protein [Sphingomonas sp. 10B4]